MPKRNLSALGLGFDPEKKSFLWTREDAIMKMIEKADWSNCIETDGYSFDPVKISFMDWDHVALSPNSGGELNGS